MEEGAAEEPHGRVAAHEGILGKRVLRVVDASALIVVVVVVVIALLNDATAQTRRRLPVQVIRDDDGGEVRDDRHVVDDDEQRREDAEGRDAEEGRDCAEAERNGSRDGREEHRQAGLAVAVGQAVCQGRVEEVARQLPRVEEDERVVGADGEDDEDGEHVEGAEVAVVEGDAVEEVGAAEGRDDAQHREARDPQRAGLHEHKDEDEAEAADGQLQVGHHLCVDLVEEERQTVVEELHLSDLRAEQTLEHRLELVQDEISDLLVLGFAVDVRVLVAGEGLPEHQDDARDGRARLVTRDDGVFAEEALQRRRRKVHYHVQYLRDVDEIRCVRLGHALLELVEEVENGVGRHALAHHLRVAERLHVLGVLRQQVRHFAHLSQVALREHVAARLLEVQLDALGSLAALRLLRDSIHHLVDELRFLLLVYPRQSLVGGRQHTTVIFQLATLYY